MKTLTQEQLAQLILASRPSSRQRVQPTERLRRIHTQAAARQQRAIEQLRSTFPEVLVHEFEQAAEEYRKEFRELLSGVPSRVTTADERQLIAERNRTAFEPLLKRSQHLTDAKQYVKYILLTVAENIVWSPAIGVVAHGAQAWNNYVDFWGSWGTYDNDLYVSFLFQWQDPGRGMVIADIDAFVTCDGILLAYASGGFLTSHYAELQASVRMTPFTDLGPPATLPPPQSQQTQQVADAVASAGLSHAEDIVYLDNRLYVPSYQGATILPDTYGSYWVVVTLDLNSYTSFESEDSANTGAYGPNWDGQFRVNCPFVQLNITYSELALP